MTAALPLTGIRLGNDAGTILANIVSTFPAVDAFMVMFLVGRSAEHGFEFREAIWSQISIDYRKVDDKIRDTLRQRYLITAKNDWNNLEMIQQLLHLQLWRLPRQRTFHHENGKITQRDLLVSKHIFGSENFPLMMFTLRKQKKSVLSHYRYFFMTFALLKIMINHQTIISTAPMWSVRIKKEFF